MAVAFGVMYAVTGSIAFGGVAAIIEPVVNVVLLPLHERLWRAIRRRAARRRVASIPRKAVEKANAAGGACLGAH
jgi:uncharacterized membrane protein